MWKRRRYGPKGGKKTGKETHDDSFSDKLKVSYNTGAHPDNAASPDKSDGGKQQGDNVSSKTYLNYGFR